MKEIVYYRKTNGKTPFVDFVSKLNNSLFAKVFYKIDLLVLDSLSFNDVKYLKEGIYELRVRDKNNIVRVFYFSRLGNKIVILDGFVKKDNKLKKNILERVISYKEDYIKRIGKI